MAELGIDGGKLKVGLDLNADLRRLGIMRDALSIASPRPRLMIDSNEYWSPKQAVRYIRQIEEKFDLDLGRGAGAPLGLRRTQARVAAGVRGGGDRRRTSTASPTSIR